MKSNDRFKIIAFLINNGWTQSVDDDNEWLHHTKENNYAIDISKDEIVLLDESGDFMHIELNNKSFYTLFGALFLNHAIAVDYKYDR